MKPANYNLFIIGTVRNVEKTLTKDVNALENCALDFKKTVFHLAESDSNDDTLRKLKQLRRIKENFNFSSFGDLKHKFPLRTDRLAHCRNFLKDWVVKRGDSNSIIVVADFDGVNANLGRDIFNEALVDLTKWDGIFANQKKYYDIWALRAKGWNEVDCWQNYNELLKTMGTEEAKEIAVTSKQISLDQNKKYYPVSSAFGGLGLYKFDFYKLGTYSGLFNNKEVCEHVSFNQEIEAKGARLCIKTNMLNDAPLEHIETPFKKFKKYIKQNFL